MWACRFDSLFRISQCTGKSDCVLVCAETAALPAGSQQCLPAVSAAEAELRAMVHSVDHSDACWYYIDPQVRSHEPPLMLLFELHYRAGCLQALSGAQKLLFQFGV